MHTQRSACTEPGLPANTQGGGTLLGVSNKLVISRQRQKPFLHVSEPSPQELKTKRYIISQFCGARRDATHMEPNGLVLLDYFLVSVHDFDLIHDFYSGCGLVSLISTGF